MIKRVLNYFFPDRGWWRCRYDDDGKKIMMVGPYPTQAKALGMQDSVLLFSRIEIGNMRAHYYWRTPDTVREGCEIHYDIEHLLKKGEEKNGFSRH